MCQLSHLVSGRYSLSNTACVLVCRVTVTGIYRATPLRVSRQQRTVRAVYKTYVDTIHFRKTDLRKLRERDDEDDDEGEG